MRRKKQSANIVEKKEPAFIIKEGIATAGYLEIKLMAKAVASSSFR